MSKKVFEYPIGIQLFNRPEYARDMLNSFKAQTCQLDQSRVFIYIDGFQGSIYERNGLEDRTADVELVAREIFPEAKIVTFSQNCGIAELHNKLQSDTFANFTSWAAFFEEDVILKPSHLEELSKLIAIVQDTQYVVKVSCFQILPSLRNLPRGYDGFYPGRGTQAFAERRTFFIDKQKVLRLFLDLIKSRTISFQFKDPEMSAKLALHGLFLPYLQHDSLVEAILSRDGLLHITSMPDLAKDIGSKGVHSYVTSPLDPDLLSNNIFRTFEERVVEFHHSLSEIQRESEEFALSRYIAIFEAFHVSLSRKLLLKKFIQLNGKKL
jgi:hypothetical protein